MLPENRSRTVLERCGLSNGSAARRGRLDGDAGLKRFLLGNEDAPSNALVFHTKHGTLRASELAGLQRRSGTFTTWAQITCVILLTGIDQG